jgi:hypothetical protein
MTRIESIWWDLGIVIWEQVQDEPLTAYPVTAYEVPPPADG